MTAPCVPTGMNAGVAKRPCGVVTSPARARSERARSVALPALVLCARNWDQHVLGIPGPNQMRVADKLTVFIACHVHEIHPGGGGGVGGVGIRT